jgi:flagellar hook-associated protein 2
MSTIQFGGVISGLNTQSIIDALMTAQKQPLTDLQNQESSLKAQSTAYGQLGTAVDDLVSSIKNFTVTAAGASRIGTSADNSVFTATATSSAVISQYDVSVDRLATATRATSTNSMGAPVTASDTSKTLQALNLPGSVTAGQISAIVDGVIVHYTVGDPTTTTLAQVMDGFGQAIQDQLRAAGPSSSPAAIATFSVVGNKLQLAVTGADDALHSISFGAASDSSNALGMLGIASASASKATNPTLTGTTNLGVTKMNGALDNAGLSGLISTQTGVLTINGVNISYDTTKDSMATLISRINNSSAGVIASIDRTNDELVLTRKDTGAIAIDVEDGAGNNLAAALNLAPGTTNAQTIGNTAQVTVDGRSITSVSNTVTNAIDGVTLNLLKQSPLGLAQGLTIGVDQSAVTTALNSFITSFNSLGDTLDKLTAMTPGQAGGTAGTSGPLASDSTIRTLFLSLRETLFGTSGSGTFNSLGAIGLNTGAIGSAAGSTDRLQLDSTQLTAALNADAGQVASLLDSATGPLSAVLAKLNTIEDPTSTKSYVQSQTTEIGGEIAELHREEASRQEMINNYQTMIEAQFASMEATLAQLQSQSAQVAATLGYSSSGTSSTPSVGSGLGSSSSGS